MWYLHSHFVCFKLSGVFIVCFLIFLNFRRFTDGRLSMIPVIVKLCDSPSKAGGLLMINFYLLLANERVDKRCTS
jgi:hypothetical protein